MSVLIVDCSNHRSRTPYGSGGSIEVEDVEGNVYLTVRPETDGEPTVDRSLTSEEARALAAALNHFAAEVER